MNKKLLLLAIPAFMALSGCSNRPVEKPEELPAAQMSEDTVAHEEGAEQLVRTTPLRATLASDYVKVGYQIQFNANGEGTADDRISIRFVAALKGEVTTAQWHRGLAQPNGYEGAEVKTGVWKYKFSEAARPSTVYYTALNNGGVRVAANEGEFEGYDRFAIYTLMDIPYEDYKDSYLAAYVELTSDNTIKSQGVAVKIERDGTASKNRFYFDPNTTGHFLEGTIEGNLRDGSDNEHTLLRATEHAEGTNSASFADLSLKTTDSFGSFYYAAGATFQFFGYSSFAASTAFPFFEVSSSMSEYCKPLFADTISVYVSRDQANKLFGSTARTVSVSFATNYGAGYGNALFIAGDMSSWSCNSSYRLSNSGDDWSGTFDIAIGTRLKYVVGPWGGGSGSRWESGDGHYVTLETTSISVEGWE